MKKKGKVLITGGTSGLGLELSKLFLKQGNEVYATGRNLRDDKIDSDRFFFIEADFSKLNDVTGAVNKLTELNVIPDIVINNAGILSPPGFTLSEDGFEISFQVNFISHLIINEMLIRQMSVNDRVLIVPVTSPVYKYFEPGFRLPEMNSYSAIRAYAESKCCLLLFGEYLSGRYPDKKIDFFGFNPGTFRSGIYRMQRPYFHTLYQIAAPFMRNPEKIARYMIQLIDNEKTTRDVIFNFTGKRRSDLPALTVDAERLFLSCKNAVNIMR